VQIQQEKEKLLMEQVGVKEEVNRALHSMTGLGAEGGRTSRTPSSTAHRNHPAASAENHRSGAKNSAQYSVQDVQDQREATARGTVERIKGLTMECKQLSDRSAQTYEKLTEDPELKALESQLQEVKKQEEIVQAVESPISH
jgi:hypothetical protein